MKLNRDSQTAGPLLLPRLCSNLEEGKNADRSTLDNGVTLNAIIVRMERKFDDVTYTGGDKCSNPVGNLTSVENSEVITKERDNGKQDEVNLEERDLEVGKAGVSSLGLDGRERGTVRSFFGYLRGEKKRGGDGVRFDGGERESNTITSSMINNPYAEKEVGRSDIKYVASPSPVLVSSSPIAIATVFVGNSVEHIVISKEEILIGKEENENRKKWCHIALNKIVKRYNRNKSTFWVASARQFRLFNRSIG